MKKVQLLCGTVSALSLAIGAAVPAFAGEGAAAGAASYRLNNVQTGHTSTYNPTTGSWNYNYTYDTRVTGSSVAGAVGKSNASAAAFNDSNSNLGATAHGSAGTLITNTTAKDQKTNGGVDNALGFGQTNTVSNKDHFSSGVSGDQVKF